MKIKTLILSLFVVISFTMCAQEKATKLKTEYYGVTFHRIFFYFLEIKKV